MSMPPKRLSKPVVCLTNNPKSKAQAVAMHILQRADDESKRSRLQSLLCHQMMNQYGSNFRHSAVNNIVQKEVSSYIKNLININDADKSIVTLQKNIERSIQLESQKSLESEKKKESHFSSSAKIEKEIESCATTTPKSDATKQIDTKSWLVFNTIVDIGTEEQERKERELKMEKKKQFKAELDKQINLTTKARETLRSEKERDYCTMCDSNAMFRADNETMRKKKIEESQRDRELRLQQIEFKRKLKEKEKYDRQVSEQDDIKRAKQMLELEEEQKRKKKEVEKLRQDAIILENERNKQIKDEIKKREHEYDLQKSREYEEKLRREEEARVTAFQARIENLKKVGQKYESVAGAAIRRKEKLEEDRTNAAVEESNRLAAEREAEKREIRRQEMALSNEINRKLLEERKMNKDAEQKAAVEARMRMEREYQELKKAEELKKEQKRLEMRDMKLTYDRQIQDQKTRDESNKLNDTEFSLNKAIISKLEDDPNLRKKVYEKVIPHNYTNTNGLKLF